MPTVGGRRPGQKHPTLTDMLGDSASRFIRDEADDQMIQRARNALRVNPFLMHFYPKIQIGRRCSCFGVNDTPDSFCISCYNIGWVGGYDKFMYHTDMIEATRPGVRLVNVLPDFKSGRTPVPFSLIKTAVQGYIEATIKLEPNVGILDKWKVHAFEPEGTSAVTYIRAVDDGDWVQATPATVQARLNKGVVRVRVVLSRVNPNMPLPYLKAIRLRYQIMESRSAGTYGVKDSGGTTVPTNTPLPEQSQQLQDMGIWETLTALQLFTDDTLSVVRNEDMLRHSANGTVWKVIQVKCNNPTGRVQTWLLNTRQIQNFDPQFNFDF